MGVFIKAWEPFDYAQGKPIDCNWRDDRRDAMRVAAILNIPFITLDLSAEYKKEVVDYMIAEYRAGRTPNPDVMCNKSIKFGAFFRRARALGADYIATGHYARVRLNEKTDKYQLLAGVDKNKDQTYFLWTLGQEELAHTLWPVGDLPKEEVRKLAKKFKLPNADKKDSQGLCFIGKLDVKDFLRGFIKAKRGNVLNEKGDIIGEHPGSLFFTIGERHGFTVFKKRPDEKPYYIVAKDAASNTLTVSHNPNLYALVHNEIKLKPVQWISGSSIILSRKYDARVRYREPLKKCRLKKLDGGEVKVIFDEVEKFVAPGQSVVIYDGGVCLGGGIIR